jgi:LysM repeat protein
MARIKRSAVVASMLMLVVIITSACNQPYSQQPSVTNTPIDTSLFATPLTGATQMTDVEIFATGTQAALLTTTPATALSTVMVGTAQASATSTPIIGITSPATTPTSTLAVSGTLSTANTSLPAGPKPATYTLQNGEFVFCIARRFNVDPDETLALNGLFDSQTVYPGLVLKIPQSGKAFPGNRMLKAHPATYTVASSSETIYGVACEFGDIDPSAIAQANGLSVGAALTSGQQLSIP